MSRRTQYVDAAGLRADGRRPDEVRSAALEFGTVPDADGSCTFSMGATTVTAYVHGPKHAANRGDVRADEAVLVCNVAHSAVSGERRRQAKRRTRGTDDLSAAVTLALESVTIVEQYPNAMINVFVEVVQGDGNDLAACVNAACCALADANVAMRDLVVAVNAGVVDGKVLVDLTSHELRSNCPTLQLGILAHDPAAIVVMNLNSRVSDVGVDDMYSAAVNACARVAEALVAALRKTVETRVEQRGATGFLQRL